MAPRYIGTPGQNRLGHDFLALERLVAPEEALMVGAATMIDGSQARQGRCGSGGLDLHAEELKKYEPAYYLHDMRDLLRILDTEKG